MRERDGRLAVWGIMVLLVALHFYVRPRLFAGRAAPDFLLVALLLYAMRTRPGAAAVAGWMVGVTVDVLGPARFGAGALAHTLVAWLASWGRSMFFADNVLVNAGFLAGGLWVRNILTLVASGTTSADLVTAATLWSPLQALSTAVTGTLVFILFRDVLAPRGDR